MERLISMALLGCLSTAYCLSGATVTAKNVKMVSEKSNTLFSELSRHSQSAMSPISRGANSNAPVLNIDEPPILLRKLGEMTISATRSPASSKIRIAGNVAAQFNPHHLYSLQANGVRYWFRFNWVTYDAANNQTHFEYCQWHNNVSPPISQPSSFELEEWQNERKSVYGRTLCMIGDSITWLGYGSFFRALLRENGLAYDLGGNHIDPFGYRHCGNGGDTTMDMIKRLPTLPSCDSYFILAGSNDCNFPSAQTSVVNIALMVNYIHHRNSAAIVYISTLTHRQDSNRPQLINSLLRGLHLPANTHLIDLQAQLPPLSLWGNYLLDTVHPNLEGYQLMARILAREIL